MEATERIMVGTTLSIIGSGSFLTAINFPALASWNPIVFALVAVGCGAALIVIITLIWNFFADISYAKAEFQDLCDEYQFKKFAARQGWDWVDLCTLEISVRDYLNQTANRVTTAELLDSISLPQSFQDLPTPIKVQIMVAAGHFSGHGQYQLDGDTWVPRWAFKRNNVAQTKRYRKEMAALV